MAIKQSKSKNAALGQAVARIRRARGLTQEQLATAVQLSRGTIAQLETGLIVWPRPDTLIQIAAALEIPVYALLQEAGILPTIEDDISLLAHTIGLDPQIEELLHSIRRLTSQEPALGQLLSFSHWLEENRPSSKDRLAAELQAAREKTGLTQTELGAHISATQQYISLVERGKKPPSWKYIIATAKACSTSALRLLQAAGLITLEPQEETILLLAERSPAVIELQRIIQDHPDQDETILRLARWITDVPSKNNIEALLAIIEKTTLIAASPQTLSALDEYLTFLATRS